MNQKNAAKSQSENVMGSISRVVERLSSYQRLMCNDQKAVEARVKQLRTSVAKSKSGVVWGPTHSFDSDEVNTQDPVVLPDIDTTNEETSSSGGEDNIKHKQRKCHDEKDKGVFGGFLAYASGAAEFVHHSSHIMCNPFEESPSSSRRKGGDRKRKVKVETATLGTYDYDLFAPPPPPQTPTPKSVTRNTTCEPIPFANLSLRENVSIAKTVSDLTMGSAFNKRKPPVATRKMAYYAVGKHSAQSLKESKMEGGNRRCYFTGQLIKSGSPFYAGCVQQELKTLVVLCLPSALGLPKKDDLERLSEVLGINDTQNQRQNSSKKSDDSNASSDGDFVESEYTTWVEDSDGNLCERIDPIIVLQALPDPNVHLLMDMDKRYPEQFQTLPTQVRSHKYWRLYIKFCFFSGLPIADGEVYYRVNNEVAKSLLPKFEKAGINEIILSHEIMEAVHGEDADTITLPFNSTFEYLQENYAQQCAKLSNNIFDRRSWEMVMPEI